MHHETKVSLRKVVKLVTDGLVQIKGFLISYIGIKKIDTIDRRSRQVKVGALISLKFFDVQVTVLYHVQRSV